MRTVNKRVIFLALLFAFAAAGLAAYYLKLSLGESLSFGKDSIEYRLLTPQDLKQLPIASLGNLDHFYYSAADGNKPLINAVEIISSLDTQQRQRILREYFISRGYKENAKGEFKKETTTASAMVSQEAAGAWRVIITLEEEI